MDLRKYHGKGYTGLVNLGNTCFLNSCMQVLNHTYELNELLDSKYCKRNIKSNLIDTVLLNEWNELRNIMWTNNGIISPNKFVYNVQELAKNKDRELFTGWAQNDITEFLLFLIESMHNSISRSINLKIRGTRKNKTDDLAIICYTMLKQIYEKEYSEIMDMFYGIYVSQLLSLDGKKTHVLKPEHFFILDLPIPENRGERTLYGCLDKFVLAEIMEGENAWMNEQTGKKEDIQKKIVFWNLPDILIITFQRFSADGKRKIQSCIDFPLENLDMSRYVSGYNSKKYIYDLFGICNHTGGVLGGHYTSFVKNSQNEWIHYNDTNVEIIKDSQNLITPMAYCLFYRKKNSLV
jgi:ubiquitin carboxyl-terminal hydrolase 8